MSRVWVVIVHDPEAIIQLDCRVFSSERLAHKVYLSISNRIDASDSTMRVEPPKIRTIESFDKKEEE
jgi:hypothetical protein